MTRAKRSKKSKQLEFEIKTHGGRRAGAGRKKARRGEPNHVRREQITEGTPVHVTLKLRKGLPALRTRPAFVRFAEAVRGARKFGLRVMQFSIQSDHVHFIAEADNTTSFSKGMQSLKIRFAKAIQRLAEEANSGRKNDRRGVFLGRYHAHVLKTPTEVKRALAYVLQNTARHWEKADVAVKKTVAASVLVQDPLSSLYLFEKPVELFGKIAATPASREFFGGDPPAMYKVVREIAGEFLSKPRSWLLRTGWMRARF